MGRTQIGLQRVLSFHQILRLVDWRTVLFFSFLFYFDRSHVSQVGLEFDIARVDLELLILLLPVLKC